MEPFFSRAGVSRVEPLLHGLVQTLIGRLDEYKGTSKIVRLDHVFSALAGDVVSAICIEDPQMSFLRDAEFNPHW
jgi:hypothetical protein